MKYTLSLLALLGSSLAFVAPQAVAQDKPAPAAKKAAKKPVAKKPAAKAAKPEAPAGLVSDEDDKEPDISAATVHIDYQCELGNKVTIYQNKGDDKYIALRWDKLVHRMRRVPTETGADRFENRRSGLIWIGIPAKGILLDAKKGQQLANECRSPAQLLLASPPTPAAPAASPVAAPTGAGTTAAPATATATPQAPAAAPATTTAAPAAVPATTPAAAPAVATPATPAATPAAAPSATPATSAPAPAPAAPEPVKDAAKDAAKS